MIIDVKVGKHQQRAYFKLAETADPTRLQVRARYEDSKTGERNSIEGYFTAQASTRGRQDDDSGGDSFDDSWTGDYDWWDNEDDYYGDDYFGQDDDYFGDDDFFSCPDETDNSGYDEVGDFEIVAFEGVITYEGCGKKLVIENANLNYTNGRFTGSVRVNDDFSGSIDYNYESGSGQMKLTSSSGQTIVIYFNGDTIEARYPDGRIERVDVNQWLNPCQGVSRAQITLPSPKRSAAVSNRRRA